MQILLKEKLYSVLQSDIDKFLTAAILNFSVGSIVQENAYLSLKAIRKIE